MHLSTSRNEHFPFKWWASCNLVGEVKSFSKLAPQSWPLQYTLVIISMSKSWPHFGKWPVFDYFKLIIFRWSEIIHGYFLHAKKILFYNKEFLSHFDFVPKMWKVLSCHIESRTMLSFVGTPNKKIWFSIANIYHSWMFVIHSLFV